MLRRTFRGFGAVGTTAVCAAVGTVAPAGASLVIDVRAVSATGATQVVNPKVVLPGAAGDVVTFDVFAVITGNNPNLGDEGLLSVAGSFLSPNPFGNGSLRGTLAATRDPLMRGPNSADGAQLDLDGDGDLDVGSNNDASSAGFFAATANTSPTPVPGVQVRVGTLTLSVTQALLSADVTEVNFRPRHLPAGTPGAGSWVEDGALRVSNNFFAGSPVTVSTSQSAWTGAANASWSTGANWLNGQEPSGGLTATFPAVVPPTGATIALGAGEAALGISFEGSYTLTGGDLTLTGGTITVASYRTATLNTRLASATGELIKRGGGTVVHAGGAVSTNGLTVLLGTYAQTGGTISLVGDMLIANADARFRSAGGALSVGGQLTVAAGTFELSAHGDRVFTVDSVLTGSGGRADLFDNDLRATDTSYSAITSQIASARAAGSWTGEGITSTSARLHPQGGTTLGALTGAQFKSVYGPGATFHGAPVADGDVLVKYTWYGDSDFSGVIDFDDYVRIDTGFNTGASGWINGDFDFSGVIDFDDYVLIDLGFNTQTGTLRAAVNWLSGDDRSFDMRSTPGTAKVMEHFAQFGLPYAQGFLSAVPEPALLGAAGGSLALLCHRRQRRR